jgi:2-haloacid dehalogenase
MPSAPSVVVFDVNETLSDMSPMATRFADVGAPGDLAKLWFAVLLRDGFALTAAGGQERFSVLAENALQAVLTGMPLDRPGDAAVEHVMAGFMNLPVHPDVPSGIRAMSDVGIPLVTLTHGSTEVAEWLLTTAGIRDQFTALLSVEKAGTWKPARGSYEYAAKTCDTELHDMLLVSVHPWDIDGAARAGMRTAWINREHASYPSHFTTAEWIAEGITGLAEQLL